MNKQFVNSDIRDGVLVVTIDRQDKLNALNAQVFVELFSVFSDASANEAVRCVVLTGAGSKAFVAGADIAELRSLDRDGVEQTVARGHQLMNLVEDLGKPVIAAVNGYALGGGCELALACHLRVASDNAMLGLPEIQLGLMPGYGGTQRLSRLIGKGRALEMMLTGKPVDAAKALEYGLVNAVIGQDDLASNVHKLAARLAQSAPCAMASILKAVNESSSLSLASGLELEGKLFSDLFGTDDMREGTAAFLEKRKPSFKGS